MNQNRIEQIDKIASQPLNKFKIREAAWFDFDTRPIAPIN